MWTEGCLLLTATSGLDWTIVITRFISTAFSWASNSYKKCNLLLIMLTSFGGGLSRGHEWLISPRWKGEENYYMLRMVPRSQRMMSVITQQKGLGHSHTPQDWSPQPPDWEIHVLIKQPMVLDYRSSKQNIRHCSAVPSDCDLLPGPQFMWAQPEHLQ